MSELNKTLIKNVNVKIDNETYTKFKLSAISEGEKLKDALKKAMYLYIKKYGGNI
jgi:hypothetical protein